MMVRITSTVKISDERGLAPVIATTITIAIVFILVGLVSSVFFEGYADSSYKGSQATQLQARFTEDGNSLEFEHNGGDPLFFDSSSLSVILDINDSSYMLNDSALGTLKVGEKKILALNRSGLPAMELESKDRVYVKVVNHERGTLIAKRELEIKRQMFIEPE